MDRQEQNDLRAEHARIIEAACGRTALEALWYYTGCAEDACADWKRWSARRAQEEDNLELSFSERELLMGVASAAHITMIHAVAYWRRFFAGRCLPAIVAWADIDLNDMQVIDCYIATLQEVYPHLRHSDAMSVIIDIQRTSCASEG